MTPTARPDENESATASFGRAVQGMILESFTVGVVLMGLVALGAGLIEASGGARLLAVLVGLGVIALAVTGWRRRWSDPVMWGAMLGGALAAVAAFTLAVS